MDDLIPVPPAERWQCASLLGGGGGDAAALEQTLGGDVAAMVRQMCAAPSAAEAEEACPAVPENAVPGTLPPLPPSAAHTAQGHAAASLFREVCRTNITTLPWPCRPAHGILEPGMCMHDRQRPSDPCMLTAADLYGEDLSGYENATLAFKKQNPSFYGFACEATDAPQPNHRLMCADPIDLSTLRASNPHAARAMESLHATLCSESST